MQFGAFARRSAYRLYGLYVWLVVVLTVVPVCAALAVAPGLDNRRRIARAGARAIFRLIGSPVHVTGAEIDAATHCVVVANHASYLDGVIMTAVLPTQFTFLIKVEMSRFPVAGFILRRLGSQFVNREDASQRHRVGRSLLEAARSGQALAVFPEGTFDAEPGLKRFHGGAFRAACRADILLYPAVILGSRAKFRAETALPRPGPLAVHVCAPLHPREHGSPGALMAATRAAILEHLGEPDLEGRELTSLRSSDPHPLRADASECSEPGP